jgi:hypothetical protein
MTGGAVSNPSFWTVAASWASAGATLALAVVAIFQEWIRSLIWKPNLTVTAKTAPPDCVSVPARITIPDIDGAMSTQTATSFYLRVLVKNVGNQTAHNVEVHAETLKRLRLDHRWETVEEFPPMNLVWSNFPGTIYFPRIAPQMGKHCDIGHIIEPDKRRSFGEEKATVDPSKASLAFDLIARPNHQGHIVGPGTYRLDIVVAADNVLPIKRNVEIELKGPWHDDEATMLRDGVSISVLDV